MNIIHDEVEQKPKNFEYNTELKNQKILHEAFINNSQISIPKPYDEYTHEEFIFSEYESFHNLDDFLLIANESQKMKAQRLIEEYILTSFFKLKKAYTDIKIENFGFKIEKNNVFLIVYDFGSIRDIQDNEFYHLLSLFQMVKNGSGPFLQVMKELGFQTSLLKNIHKNLLSYWHLILEPFYLKDYYNLNNWNRTARSKKILGLDKSSFMIAAPGNWIFYLRTFKGLFHLCENFKAPFNGKTWVDRSLKEHQVFIDQILNQYDIDCAEDEGFINTVLRIQIRKDDNLIENITLPRRAIDSIENFMKFEILSNLQEQKIDLNDIVKECQSSGYCAQELFEYNSENKHIKVYLE